MSWGRGVILVGLILRSFVLPVLITKPLVSSANAQNFATIKSFGVLTNTSGFYPRCQLAQGPDGTLYGTATAGEFNVVGTVFKVHPDGSGFAVLKWFTNSFEEVIIPPTVTGWSVPIFGPPF